MNWFTSRPRMAALVTIIWTAITWGGRVSLLGGPEAASVTTWVRIAGSMVMGIILALGFWKAGRMGASGMLMAGGLWVGAIWGSSLASVWINEHALGFRLVHTVLAIVSLGLGGAGVLIASRTWRSGRAVTETSR